MNPDRVFSLNWLQDASANTVKLRVIATGRIAAGAVLLLALTAGCGPGANAPKKRIVVLGIDGMDPAFLEGHWDALPHLKQLRDSGDFQRLATTIPPQSPVAWSTF